jgi:hypothetical protein
MIRRLYRRCNRWSRDGDNARSWDPEREFSHDVEVQVEKDLAIGNVTSGCATEFQLRFPLAVQVETLNNIYKYAD